MTIYAHTNVFIWNVQSIIIHNNPKGNYEKTFNWKMAKRIMAILYNGILLNNKKKQITHMYKHRWIKNPCTKLKKLDTNQNKTKPCIYMVLFVWHSAKVKIIKMGIMVVATGYRCQEGCGLISKGTRECFGLRVYILVVVLVTWLYLCIRIHWNVSLKKVHFTLCKLYLNKSGIKIK